MEGIRYKSFRRAFLRPPAVLGVIVLTAIICIGAPQIKGRPASAAKHRADNSEAVAEQAGEWQTVKMRVTAYCPCEKCCGEYADGVTACGHKIRKGDAFVAADKKYPFGSEIIIAGYNNSEPVKVLDRGGAIRGDRLDVFFHTHQEALKWGVKYLHVKVRQAL